MHRIILKYLFALSLIGLSLYYLLSIITKDPKSISILIANTPLSIIIWTIVFSVLGGLSNTFLWFIINKKLTPETNFHVSYFAWSTSRVLRYIPGKAIGYYVRQKLQKSNIKNGIKSSVNEALITLMTTSLLSTTYYLINIQKKYSIYFILVSVILYLSILFIKPITKYFEDLLLYFKIRIGISTLFNVPQQLLIYSFYGLPALLLHGTSFYLLIKYGLNSDSVDFLFSTVTFYFSGIVGQLSLIAPAGLGVREASLTFLMANQGFNADIALIAALGSRVILITSELINLFLASLLRFYYSHEH